MKWKPLPLNYSKRCVVLDINGKRCPKKAAWKGPYHGDHEIYSGLEDKPTWVLVEICKDHASKCK